MQPNSAGDFIFNCAILLLAVCAGSAMAEPLQVNSLTMTWRPSASDSHAPYTSEWNNGAIKMPLVITGDARVAARINDALFLSLMEIPAPAKEDKTFSASPDGTASMDFTVLRNDGQFLSISVTADGCGAYCETYIQYFNFDARTGKFLSIEDIVTSSGASSLVRRMIKERKRRYVAQIKLLKRAQMEFRKKQSRNKTDAPDEFEDRIMFNDECLSRESEKQTRDAVVSRGDLDYYQMLLSADKKLMLISERCSAHVDHALDDVDEVALELPFDELSPFLNAYGKSLLLGLGEAAAPSPFGQVLHGKIGGAAVSMWLGRIDADGSFRGSYFYDKYRKPIFLRGKRSGKNLSIATWPGGAESESFALSFAGTLLSGQWTGSGKRYPVTFSW